MDARPALAHTPLKSGENQAQFKTPLRTPLSVLEQKSSTPITPFEAIESQKENVQPRARGRSAHALSTTLSMHHKERQETLAAQRREWEERVKGGKPRLGRSIRGMVLIRQVVHRQLSRGEKLRKWDCAASRASHTPLP